jgi:hypothetical protein
MELENRVDGYIDSYYCHVSLNHVCDRNPNVNFCYDCGTRLGWGEKMLVVRVVQENILLNLTQKI